jgi:hypothetical protein
MSEIIQKDGVDIEVFTAEEIEAQKQEAIEQYKLDNPDKTDELTQLQEELRIKEEELSKAKDKDANFANLRKQKEAAEKKITDITAEIDSKIQSVKKEVMEGVMKDHYNDTLKAFAGEDEEIKKKIEFHFKRLGDVASTKEEISNKMRDAYLLATKPEGYDALNSSVISTGGVGRLNIKSQGQKLSADEKVMASKFGLSDADLKKYNA